MSPNKIFFSSCPSGLFFSRFPSASFLFMLLHFLASFLYTIYKNPLLQNTSSIFNFRQPFFLEHQFFSKFSPNFFQKNLKFHLSNICINFNFLQSIFREVKSLYFVYCIFINYKKKLKENKKRGNKKFPSFNLSSCPVFRFLFYL